MSHESTFVDGAFAVFMVFGGLAMLTLSVSALLDSLKRKW